MEEIWKDINDYEGLYQVSNLGRIKKFKKKSLCWKWKDEMAIRKDNVEQKNEWKWL